MNPVEQNINKIISLCEQHKVMKMYMFGSVLSEHFSENSDLDFVVSFKDMELSTYADNYFDLKFSLEKIFNRKVDLLENQAIRNPYLKKSIDSSKQLIYG